MEENKKLDDLVRAAVKEAGLDVPPLDFTDSILVKILPEAKRNSVFIHQPLLPKWVWIVILCVFVIICIYAVFDTSDVETTLFSFGKMNQLASVNVFGKVPNLNLSSIYVYAFSIFSIFAIIQIIMAKRRIDKFYKLI